MRGFRRITLGGAMALIAVITLLTALIVRNRKAAEQESRAHAEIARLRAELEFERTLHSTDLSNVGPDRVAAE